MMQEADSMTPTNRGSDEEAALYWFGEACSKHNETIKMRDILEKCEDALLYPRDDEKRKLALKEIENWFNVS